MAAATTAPSASPPHQRRPLAAAAAAPSSVLSQTTLHQQSSIYRRRRQAIVIILSLLVGVSLLVPFTSLSLRAPPPPSPPLAPAAAYGRRGSEVVSTEEEPATNHRHHLHYRLQQELKRLSAAVSSASAAAVIKTVASSEEMMVARIAAASSAHEHQQQQQEPSSALSAAQHEQRRKDGVAAVFAAEGAGPVAAPRPGMMRDGRSPTTAVTAAVPLPPAAAAVPPAAAAGRPRRLENVTAGRGSQLRPALRGIRSGGGGYEIAIMAFPRRDRTSSSYLCLTLCSVLSSAAGAARVTVYHSSRLEPHQASSASTQKQRENNRTAPPPCPWAETGVEHVFVPPGEHVLDFYGAVLASHRARARAEAAAAAAAATAAGVAQQQPVDSSSSSRDLIVLEDDVVVARSFDRYLELFVGMAEWQQARGRGNSTEDAEVGAARAASDDEAAAGGDGGGGATNSSRQLPTARGPSSIIRAEDRRKVAVTPSSAAAAAGQELLQQRRAATAGGSRTDRAREDRPPFILSLYDGHCCGTAEELAERAAAEAARGDVLTPGLGHWGWGSQALVFRGGAMLDALVDHFATSRRAYVGLQDLFIADFARERGVPTWAARPSLVQHVGAHSALFGAGSTRFHQALGFLDDAAEIASGCNSLVKGGQKQSKEEE